MTRRLVVGVWTLGEEGHEGPHPFDVRVGDCIMPSALVASCTSLAAADAVVRLFAADGCMRILPHFGRPGVNYAATPSVVMAVLT